MVRNDRQATEETGMALRFVIDAHLADIPVAPAQAANLRALNGDPAPAAA